MRRASGGAGRAVGIAGGPVSGGRVAGGRVAGGRVAGGRVAAPRLAALVFGLGVCAPFAISTAAPPAVAPSSPAAAAVTMPAPVPTPAAAYADECAACHVAYPARLLATSQWFAVLSALDEHYGVDATVDAATLALVARHLGVAAGVPHAGERPRHSPLPRITTQRWFVREHREARGTRGAEKPSQCDTCHAGAARGQFEEHGEEHGDERD